MKREEETTDDEDYGNTKAPITKPKRRRFTRRNDLMIWARDSDNVNAETYLAYLDEEANNQEKEGSERVWIRWDTNVGRKVCLHKSRIVDKLTSRRDKKLKFSEDNSRPRNRKDEIANASAINAAVEDINSNLTEVAASSNNGEDDDDKEVKVDAEVVENFFLRLSGCNSYNTSFAEDLVEDIKKHPYLLNQTCPMNLEIDTRPGRGEMETIKTKGYTAIEIMCLDDFHCDAGLEMLWKLICLGAKTTANCYWGIVDEYSPEYIVEHFIALLCAGRKDHEWLMPTSDQYFLDELVRKVNSIKSDRSRRLYQKQIFDIICKQVKMGDEIIGYGKVDNPIILNNINELRVDIGRTHANMGALEKSMVELYPEEAWVVRKRLPEYRDSDEDY